MIFQRRELGKHAKEKAASHATGNWQRRNSSSSNVLTLFMQNIFIYEAFGGCYKRNGCGGAGRVKPHN